MKRNRDVLDKIWVVNFETLGICDIKLRRGTRNEVEDFNEKIQPTINRYVRRHGKPKTKKQAPYKIQHKIEDEFKLKVEVLRMVNKFLLAKPIDPNPKISKFDVFHKIPTVTLYFKGPYTSLALKHGLHQWHYFIPPPSPFPAWFYQEHTNIIKEGPTVYVKVPKTVEMQFYNALLHLLPTLFSIHV
ncbi:uncharacterized protein LOC113239816 [Hyposmocoma kahamanoa]|uniref:uncharacterized protein LOC113239816 n=1 Tax=Hyposmocoma kahamanoa TaxID=1477025 RepID=UPI000E6D8636|nr:uncharacterized protein LOC113239816 [Hyposmocoma kahamanoa]